MCGNLRKFFGLSLDRVPASCIYIVSKVEVLNSISVPNWSPKTIWKEALFAPNCVCSSYTCTLKDILVIFIAHDNVFHWHYVDFDM